jgi:multicomponent Na+:H+ antiporter subunit A
MLAAVLSSLVLALVAPGIQRLGRGAGGWLIAALPLGLMIYFASQVQLVAGGAILGTSYPWVPSLGVALSFRLDGLSLLFALLITGIGTLVIVYAGGYLAGHPQLGRFYAYIVLFMASMLGLVLADNVFALFIFWELTGISSYLLIGFDHERAEARGAALQALLVTAAGGLALLAGLILLGLAGGSWETSVLLDRGAAIRAHPLHLPALLLILAGAFTKSAQVPFHFWLPGAMQAPTPVSAYLHSATMVKAGVYLLARLSPVLGGTDEWHYILSLAGAVTMLAGAVLALTQTDLKLLLAYSTVSALGTLTLLLGLNTVPAATAAMVFLLVHSLYKGALFLAAGAIDHETGTRNIDRLGGIYRLMPITAAAAALAALSMAGLPPLFGFISKELLYEAKLQAPYAAPLITGAGVLTNVLMVAIAAIIGLGIFRGQPAPGVEHAHEPTAALWLGPLLLAGLGLIIGLFPDGVAELLIAPAVSALRAEATEVELALWHGLNPILALGVATIAGGVAIYTAHRFLRHTADRLRWLTRWGPSRGYAAGLDGMMAVARVQTRVLQNGYLRVYLLIVIATAAALAGTVLLAQVDLTWGAGWREVRSYEWALTAAILLAALWITATSSRPAAVASLGVVGYGVALVFVLFGAPDLAMTQIAIETLTVILFLLAIYRMPPLARRTPPAARVRDGVAAAVMGALMAALLLAATALPRHSRVTEYFAESSVALAKGRNIVNVILVDFRALDTLGEITVLAVAAVGVFALLKLRPRNDAAG